MTREEILDKFPLATEADIKATLAAYDRPSIGGGMARAAAQGITFGFSDEMSAWARSLFGRDYSELIEEERRLLHQFREDHPTLAYGTEIGAGMLIPGVGLGKGAFTAGKLALQSGNVGKALRGGRQAQQIAARQPMRIGRAAKVGAGQGSLYGAGASEGGALDRLQGAAIGGAAGAIAGPLAAKAADLGGAAMEMARFNPMPNRMLPGDKLARPAANRLTAIAAREAGQDRTRQLASEGLPPTEIYREGLQEMGPEAMIADAMGERGKRFASGITQGSSDAGAIAAERLAARAEQEYARVTADASRLMNARVDATRMADTLDKRAASLSRPIYKAAERGEGSVLDLDDFADFFVDNADDFRKAYNKARSIARREGTPIPEWKVFAAKQVSDDGGFLGFDSPEVGIRTMQLIKQGLDGMVEVGKKPATTIGAAELASLKAIRNQFTTRLGDFNPTFKLANKIRKVGYDIQDAVDAGMKATKSTEVDEVARQFRALSSDIERTAFRSGMLQNLKLMGRKESVSLARKINNDRVLKEQLRATFPDEATFNQFMGRLETESKFGGTLANVTGGSRTARTLTDIDESLAPDPDALLKSAYSYGIDPTYAAVQGAGWVTKAVRKFRNKKLAAEASEIMFSEPGKAIEKLDQLKRIYQHQMTDKDIEILNQMRRRLVGGSSRAIGSTISSGEASPQGLLNMFP
tara:strand:- start:1809 stop:3899 length:2091 start_codon:yes stop_codon:yes gene_type:complete